MSVRSDRKVTTAVAFPPYLQAVSPRLLLPFISVVKRTLLGVQGEDIQGMAREKEGREHRVLEGP